MSDRAAALAASFEQANTRVIEAIEFCSEEQLQTLCPDEGWSAVVTAHHLALSYPAIAGMVQMLATGEMGADFSLADLDAFNAQHAKEFANVSREETLVLLRQNGKAAADLVRGFTDEQLDRSAVLSFTDGQPWSAADLTERGLIGHPLDHGQHILTALGMEAPAPAR